MAPLSFYWNSSPYTVYVMAFVVGILFGFVLEQAGFGNARKLALTFYFRDMSVIKVMFTALLTAMIGTVVLSSVGFLNMDNVWINPSYIPASLLGGLFMGVGFAVGGYCPGTSVVGMATLKTDALANFLGALLGMAISAEFIDLFWGFYNGGLLGERITLPEYFNLSVGTVAFFIILMALMMFLMAEFFEARFKGVVEK